MRGLNQERIRRPKGVLSGKDQRGINFWQRGALGVELEQDFHVRRVRIHVLNFNCVMV